MQIGRKNNVVNHNLNIYDEYLFNLCECSVGANEASDIKLKHLTYNLVKSLVEAGAYVDALNRFDRSPLLYAIINNNPVMVEVLLSFGANPNIETNYKSYKEEGGESLLHIASLFNQVESVKLLLQYGAEINAKNNKLNTPLHYACACSTSNEVVKLLIERGAEVNSLNEEGTTPIFNAVTQKNFDAINILLENNADINIVSEKVGMTPLIAAITKAGRHHIDLINFLIDKGADVNIRINKYHPPNQIELLHGATPLHIACKNLRYIDGNLNHYEEVIKTLIKRGAEINTVDFDGNTPLNVMYLDDRNYIDMVGYMLMKGANPTIENNDGVSPLSKAKAKTYNCYNTVKLMKKYSKPKTTRKKAKEDNHVDKNSIIHDNEGK